MSTIIFEMLKEMDPEHGRVSLNLDLLGLKVPRVRRDGKGKNKKSTSLSERAFGVVCDNRPL